MQGWTARSDDEAVLAAAAAIIAHVDELLPQLINTGISESQLHPSGLHEKFNALFESVDSADYAPPRQAGQVFEQLSAELGGYVEQVKTALGEKVAAFNEAIRGLGLGAVDSRCEVVVSNSNPGLVLRVDNCRGDPCFARK